MVMVIITIIMMMTMKATTTKRIMIISESFLAIYFALFSGSENEFVIISLVRSLPDSQIDYEPTGRWLRENLGFVTDEHQMNVALTRAKQGLCIIGEWDKKNIFFLRSLGYVICVDNMMWQGTDLLC